ncbi:MAG: LysR family transcriptional regulator [Candidatus Latescibacterota bacterium]|nr:MAG: LysR family transcriptional regulator [Candidatus Latescibacterota bacterium]
MEIRQLRYFLAAIRHGSLRAAARDHFVTQPAVSIQLKKLEDEVGEKLYVRRGKRIEPTQAGSILATEAEEIVRKVDAVTHRIQGLKGLESGLLKMGNIDAASVYVLPDVFKAFRRRHPGIDIQVLVADSDSLLAALETGAIELAIVTLPLPGEAYEVVPIFEDKMVLVAPPGHELVGSRSRRNLLRRVAETGLITYPAKSTTRRLIEKVFIDNGLGLKVTMETSSPEAIKRLTEAGLGASILPIEVVSNEIRRGSLKAIPTGKIRFSRMLGLVYKSAETLSPPAKAFLSMLVEKYK